MWCVLMKRTDGDEFVAHTPQGAAVFYFRAEAVAEKKRLAKLNFIARVSICFVDTRPTPVSSRPLRAKQRRGKLRSSEEK